MTNRLTVTIYPRGSTSPAVDNAGDLRRASVESFETFWPGGVFGPAAIRIPRDVTANWPFAGGQRVVIRNGLDVVYEGFIPQIGYGVGQGADQYRRIAVAGATGQIMGAWSLNKPWADNRIDDQILPEVGTYAGAALATLDRNSRIKFIPKAVAWSGNNAAVRYTAPTGQTIKRVTYDYNLQEGAQAWHILLYNNGTAAAEATTTITASGTGSIDRTLGTASQSIEFRFGDDTPQTGIADGSIYGQFSNIVIYTETGSINLTEIAKDVRAVVTDLNSDESQIASNALSLVPFVTAGRETAASILSRAAALGDGSYNSWYWDLLESDAAAAPNGEPVLRVAQYPALTDYDYAVRLDDPNLNGGLEIVKDYDGIRNWIAVRYTDLTGKAQVITPDDDANLTDAASVAAYGHRELPAPLDAGQVSSTVATNYARRYLALYKDPRFYLSGDVTVKGYILAKGGQRVPAANIRAGKRLRVLNFLTDESGVASTGLTWHITRTRYSDAAQTCSISTGVSDDLAVFIARLQAGSI